METLIFKSLGKRPYGEVFDLQRKLRVQRMGGEIPDTLLTVEHPRVITRGRRPADEDFRVAPEELRKRGFELADAGRGGKLTYHGPGQLVGYFIFSLPARRLSIPQFVRRVEECVIQTLLGFQVPARRREGCPGVWVEGRKIASVGLSIDRGVSMHGVALNIDPELTDFDVIIPCGIPDCQMTSVKKELGSAPSFSQVEKVLQNQVLQIFP